MSSPAFRFRLATLDDAPALLSIYAPYVEKTAISFEYDVPSLDEFRHEHLGQLNAYVSYYRDTQMAPGDNPPIGILLCTGAGPKMVEYATASLDTQFFVSKYLIELPQPQQLAEFIQREIKTFKK